MVAIDESAHQIRNAIPRDNIEYRCHSAENLTFVEANSVDLITVAAALHWLNLDLFFKEVKRVLKQHTGVLAIWTYSSGKLDNMAQDKIYQHLIHVELLPYWNERRWLVEDYYASLMPLFPYQSTRCEYTFEQQKHTTIQQLLGLIESWSGAQSFRLKNGNDAFQAMLHSFGEKMAQCYSTSTGHNAEASNYTAPIIISNPIRLYLMRNCT